MPQAITEENKKQLLEKGYTVKPSSTKSGKYRWFYNTGGDNVSVPAVECSDNTFETEALAWSDALTNSASLAAM